MSFNFEWKPELSVHEGVIDIQHKKLLSQVNTVIAAILKGVKTKDVEDAIFFFDEYIHGHLTYEEGYMIKNNYPEFYNHRKMHEDFINKYNLFKDKLKSGVPAGELILEVETYIGQWWLNHIAVEDKKYDIFING
ncbi:MAG: hemerythrin family protein [Candidatus Paceibacterota bacterium]|jgi:hemerythrin